MWVIYLFCDFVSWLMVFMNNLVDGLYTSCLVRLFTVLPPKYLHTSLCFKQFANIIEKIRTHDDGIKAEADLPGRSFREKY